MNFLKYKTYTSFEPPSVIQTSNVAVNVLLFSNYFFCLFQWNTEVVNNQQFFFLLILTKKKPPKQLHRTMKRKVNSFEVGLNMVGVQTSGFEAQRKGQMMTSEKWCTCSFWGHAFTFGQFVTRVYRLVSSHMVPHYMTWPLCKYHWTQWKPSECL